MNYKVYVIDGFNIREKMAQLNSDDEILIEAEKIQKPNWNWDYETVKLELDKKIEVRLRVLSKTIVECQNEINYISKLPYPKELIKQYCAPDGKIAQERYMMRENEKLKS